VSVFPASVPSRRRDPDLARAAFSVSFVSTQAHPTIPSCDLGHTTAFIVSPSLPSSLHTNKAFFLSFFLLYFGSLCFFWIPLFFLDPSLFFWFLF